jgi:anti-sigma B factor antagonist
LSATGPITTSVALRDGVAVLSVGGDIDLATAPVLEAAIAQVTAGNPRSVIIELSAVDFLASTGLRILVAAQEMVSKSAGFAVVANSPATSRPIQLTGLAEVLSVHPTLDAALAAVRTLD